MKILIILAALAAQTAFAQDVSQTLRVEPGTVITISRNGQMIMQKVPRPGLVSVRIHYLEGNGGQRVIAHRRKLP